MKIKNYNAPFKFIYASIFIFASISFSNAFAQVTDPFKTNEIKTLSGKSLSDFNYNLNACAKSSKMQGLQKSREITLAGESVMNDYEKLFYLFYKGTTYFDAQIYRAKIISGDGTGEFIMSLVNPPHDFIAKYQKAIGKTKWKKIDELPEGLGLQDFTDADAAIENIFIEDVNINETLYPRLIIEANTNELTKNKYVILRCQLEF